MKRPKSRGNRVRSPRHPVAPSGPKLQPFGQFRMKEITVEPVPPDSWPTISVCMIVKNEEANLRACVESMGDLASEIIIVDTGSTDRTVEIAEELAARIRHFPWRGDFAAARNESIRDATGDWLFWIDADDRLTPNAVAQLKRAAASGAADAYVCLVSSRVPGGWDDVAEHIRLFKNHPEVRFSSAVHETVFPQLVRLGTSIAYTDITVIHTGYTSQEAKREKAARNLAILDRELALDPGNADLLFYRGQARGLTGDSEGLVADMATYLEMTTATEQFNFMRFWAYASVVGAKGPASTTETLERWLLDALKEFPSHPSFLYRLGILHMGHGKTEQALPELEASHASNRDGVRGLRPPQAEVEIRLAQCHRTLKQNSQALEWASRVWNYGEGPTEAGAMLVYLHMDEERMEDAEAAMQRLMASSDEPLVWLTLADLRHHQQRTQEAEEALRQARAHGLPESQANELLARIRASRVLAGTRTQTATTDRQTAIQLRGLTLLSQGRDQEAADCFARAINEMPTDPDNYKYLAVALRKIGREKEAMEAWQLAQHWKARASAGGAPTAAIPA